MLIKNFKELSCNSNYLSVKIGCPMDCYHSPSCLLSFSQDSMFQPHCKVMTFIDLEMSHHSLLQKPWGSLSYLKEYLNCSWAPTQTVTTTQLMLCALGLLIHPFVIITGWLLSLDSPSPLPAEPGASTPIDQGSFPLLSVFTVQWWLGFSMCVLVFQFSGELPEV